MFLNLSVLKYVKYYLMFYHFKKNQNMFDSVIATQGLKLSDLAKKLLEFKT